jgi:hypothetical protein
LAGKTGWHDIDGGNPFAAKFSLEKEDFGRVGNELRDPEKDKITKIWENGNFDKSDGLAQVFFLALGIGKKREIRKPLKSGYSNIDTALLNTEQNKLIVAACYDELAKLPKNKDKSMIEIFEDNQNISEIKKIAQEYANGGIEILYDSFVINPTRGWKRIQEILSD